MRILLASKSPRRRKLVETFNLEVELVDIEVEEVLDHDVPADRVAETLACLKSDGYKKPLADGEVLLTADTVVVVDGMVIGKPHDRTEAVEMLRNLSDKTHTVYTGVCLRSSGKSVSFTERTDVHFRMLTDKEIDYYIDNYKPYDKAGAYGIQEWIGMIGVDRIEGDYYNVMGLPVAQTYQTIMEISSLQVRRCLTCDQQTAGETPAYQP